VDVPVRVAVAVDVEVPVSVRVGVTVRVAVGVRVGVSVGVRVRVAVGVEVGTVPVMMISPSRIVTGMSLPRLFRICTRLRMTSDWPGATAENVMIAISSLPLKEEPSSAASKVITPVALSAMLTTMYEDTGHRGPGSI